MMDYFKKNPSALMDAIPTPKADDEDDKLLSDFRTGLTPKRNAFKFGGFSDAVRNRPSYNANNTSISRERGWNGRIGPSAPAT